MSTPEIAMSTPRTTHPVTISDNDCFTTIPYPPTVAGPVFPDPPALGRHRSFEAARHYFLGVR